MQPIRRTIRPASRGFSLIEILVVLTIILLLMGIAFVTMGRSVTNARIAATKTTIAILDSALQRQFEALMQDFSEQERTNAKRIEWGNLAAGQYYAQSLSPAPATTTSAAAKAIVKLNRYIGTFPQRWEDMWGFDGASGSSDGGALPVADDAWDPSAPTRKILVAAASRYGFNATNLQTGIRNDKDGNPNDNGNAELFFLLVTSDTNGQQVLDQISARHIGDTDGDGIRNYLDSDDDGDGIPTKLDNTGLDPADTDVTDDDTDGDGIPNYLDNDDDGDGVLSKDEDFDGDGNPANDDTDGDGIANALDTDDDNDGTLTKDQDTTIDTDNDGIPDYADTQDTVPVEQTTFKVMLPVVVR